MNPRPELSDSDTPDDSDNNAPFDAEILHSVGPDPFCHGGLSGRPRSVGSDLVGLNTTVHYPALIQSMRRANQSSDSAGFATAINLREPQTGRAPSKNNGVPCVETSRYAQPHVSESGTHSKTSNLIVFRNSLGKYVIFHRIAHFYFMYLCNYVFM